MNTSFCGYKRKDIYIAAMLSVFFLLICGSQLTRGMPSWGGDDFASYISEGIAISTESFQEQVLENLLLHPSPLPAEVNEDGLVYVWGFPLLLSLVHHFVGFDLVNYSSFLFYKIPSLICFALMSGVLYLYYRRFFSTYLSVFLTLLFCAGRDFIDAVNLLNVDIPFLFFSLLTLLAAECFFSSISKPERKRSCPLSALGLGLSFWLTYETRLNGSTVLLIVAFSHILRLFQTKEKLSFRQALVHLSPYILFTLLKIVTESILLPATSNLSDVGNLSFDGIKYNLQYYYELTRSYWESLSGTTRFSLWVLFCLLTTLGILKEGTAVQNLHLSLLLIGTYLILILLPYTQGLRYMFNILPILLLYAACGGSYICNWFAKKLRINGKAKQVVLMALSVLVLLHIYLPVFQNSIANLKTRDQLYKHDVYSQEAIDMYRYIQENTDPGARIAFQKPRALYLNTGRPSFAPYLNGRKLYDADYFLASTDLFPYSDIGIIEKDGHNFTLIYENESFSLYKLPPTA